VPIEPADASGEGFADKPAPRVVQATQVRFSGRVWDIVSDTVDLGDGRLVQRDVMEHPGAVAVMALNERDEVYLVSQYRHPVRAELWEPPAGLLDVEGEDPLIAAQRELWEEADLRAGQWHVLQDFYTSPGGSSEHIRVFLARDITEVPDAERHEREDEERDMAGAWVPLNSVLAAIAAGRVKSPTMVTGAYALDAARRADWSTLRPSDAPLDVAR